MFPHHQRAIDSVTAHFTDHPDFLALIVGGSIAKGWQTAASDVDIILVATDRAYARRQADNHLTFYTTDFCDYEGGYIDGKIVSLAFLQEVAARGSEPARAAFDGAWITWSRLPDLPDLLAAITAYPEATHVRKLESFYAQLEAARWYVGEAEKRDQRYLLLRYVSEVVLYAGRMILAHNRMLYPFHKWLMAALESAPDKPADLLLIIAELLADPGKAHADRLFDCVTGFTEWPTPSEGWPGRFMQDAEWNWRGGTTPIADC